MENTFEVTIGEKHITAYSDIRGWDLKPGDMYIAKRNTGWQLGKCTRVRTEPGTMFVEGESETIRFMYPYDCGECYKVKDINYTILGGLHHDYQIAILSSYYC